MKSFINVILNAAIKDEKSGKDYDCDNYDRELLNSMFKRINRELNSNYHYLAEIALLDIKGSGSIMAEYFDEFHSEEIRGYIVTQLVADKVIDCDKIIFDGYMRFKSSDEYSSSPTNIAVRYDNAFKRLKPKRLKNELLTLATNYRDAFYLPLTMRMLSSWKLPEMENILYAFLDDNALISGTVCMVSDSVDGDKTVPFMKRELKFTAIHGLRYYPTDTSVDLLQKCISDSDIDIASSAKKSLDYIKKHNK